MQELLQRVEGDRQFMQEFPVMFHSDSQITMRKPKVCMGAEGLAGVSRAVQTPKGAGRN